MKNLFITLVLIFAYQPSAFADSSCEFTSETQFECLVDGESGLEIFEDLSPEQVEANVVVNEDSQITYVYNPVLKGHNLDIEFCLSEVKSLYSGVKATCHLKKKRPDYSKLTVLPTNTDKTTILPARNKTTIYRADVR